MINTKPIHLRNDEYNDYIQEYKEPFVVLKRALTPEEKNIVYRTGLDYGLEISPELDAQSYVPDPKDYNIIFRIKGPFTLPESVQWNGERGTVNIRPYIIHESATAERLKEIAEDCIQKEMVDAPIPIDVEYLHEALRESSFTISMEEVLRLGKGFQIVQVEFDEQGHFKAFELDETY
jgi:hypothetical protein